MADVRARSRGRMVRRVDRGDMVLGEVILVMLLKECVCAIVQSIKQYSQQTSKS